MCLFFSMLFLDSWVWAHCEERDRLRMADLGLENFFEASSQLGPGTSSWGPEGTFLPRLKQPLVWPLLLPGPVLARGGGVATSLGPCTRAPRVPPAPRARSKINCCRTTCLSRSHESGWERDAFFFFVCLES